MSTLLATLISTFTFAEAILFSSVFTIVSLIVLNRLKKEPTEKEAVQ